MGSLIKKIFCGVATITCLMSLSGCMNLYVRCPFTDSKIERTYQCTEDSFVYSYVIMFPQTMSHGTDKLVPLNAITIPIGCICFVDVLMESVVDTICWPYDKCISLSNGE